jgi:hypothetical protein
MRKVPYIRDAGQHLAGLGAMLLPLHQVQQTAIDRIRADHLLHGDAEFHVAHVFPLLEGGLRGHGGHRNAHPCRHRP